MISSLKYMPILFASMVTTGSFVFKVIASEQPKLTYFLRDIIIFFIVYYITKALSNNLARIFKNYWKIL